MGDCHSILPNSENKKVVNLIDKDTGSPIHPENVAEYVNEFFTGIGPKLASKFTDPWAANDMVRNVNTMGLFNVTEAEVIDLCKSICVTKSSALDFLSTRILKHAFLAVPQVLTRCVQLSIEQGTFPEAWKCAKVGDASDVTNYRPISLLPLPGKLLEKIVHKRLITFVEDQHILDERQGGFRPGHSTIQTISELTDNIALNINNTLSTLVTYIDFKKAFDTVDHDILLKKLDLVGIRNTNHKWLRSYFSNRTQCTLANNTSSTVSSITCGVAQGSILGPFLFLIYLNDIGTTLNGVNAMFHADDTVLYTAGCNKESIFQSMQRILDELAQWRKRNRLTINVNKTKYCVFGSKRSVNALDDVHLSLNGCMLEQIVNYTYLAVYLDTHLTYQPHLNYIIKLVSHKIFLLTKVRSLVDTNTAIQI